MSLMKTATLITFMFMCRFGFADVAPSNVPPGCTQMNITDAAEVTKLMDSLQGQAHEEKLKDGEKTIIVKTKEIKLGGKTTLTCRSLTQDGNPVSYFRGSRPGCTFVQTEAVHHSILPGTKRGDPGSGK